MFLFIPGSSGGEMFTSSRPALIDGDLIVLTPEVIIVFFRNVA